MANKDTRQTPAFQTTDWFNPAVDPDFPGSYDCTLGAGHVYARMWTGTTWISPISGLPTTVRMLWRGVVPGSVSIGLYPSAVRLALRDSMSTIVPGVGESEALGDITAILGDPARARASKALYDETMDTP